MTGRKSGNAASMNPEKQRAKAHTTGMERTAGNGARRPWDRIARLARSPFSDWAETCATLHLWMQIVGKVRLAHAPMVNHWWQVAFYVTCRG